MAGRVRVRLLFSRSVFHGASNSHAVSHTVVHTFSSECVTSPLRAYSPQSRAFEPRARCKGKMDLARCGEEGWLGIQRQLRLRGILTGVGVLHG